MVWGLRQNFEAKFSLAFVDGWGVLVGEFNRDDQWKGGRAYGTWPCSLQPIKYLKIPWLIIILRIQMIIWGVKYPIFRQTHQGVAEWNRMMYTTNQLQLADTCTTKNGTCWVRLSFSGHCLATPWKDGFLQFITTNPWDFTFQSLKRGCPTSPIPTSY